MKAEEEKTGVEGEGEAEESAGEEAVTEETGGEGEGEEAVTEETGGESEEEDGEKVAPTIELEIYQGPTYSEDDGICYYRVKAVVTGNPAPTVEFSRDDSLGSFGSKKAQVNLYSTDETYTLTATAANSEGEATGSITLSWGCEVENQDPEISEITLMGNHFTGVQYEVSAAASDPDGDSLSYQWSVTGGTIEDSSTNPIKWTTPNTAGNYNLTVIVDDGNGGTAAKTETVEVVPLEVETTISADGSLSGYIIGNDLADAVAFATFDYVSVRDHAANKYVKGYLTFDISDLCALRDIITIKEVEIRIPGVGHINNPWLAGSQINIKEFDYGSSLDPNDFKFKRLN